MRVRVSRVGVDWVPGPDLMVGSLTRRRPKLTCSLLAGLDDIGEPSALAAAHRPSPTGVGAFGYSRVGSARPRAGRRAASRRAASWHESTDIAVGPAAR